MKDKGQVFIFFIVVMGVIALALLIILGAGVKYFGGPTKNVEIEEKVKKIEQPVVALNSFLRLSTDSGTMRDAIIKYMAGEVSESEIEDKLNNFEERVYLHLESENKEEVLQNTGYLLEKDKIKKSYSTKLPLPEGGEVKVIMDLWVTKS